MTDCTRFFAPRRSFTSISFSPLTATTLASRNNNSNNNNNNKRNIPAPWLLLLVLVLLSTMDSAQSFSPHPSSTNNNNNAASSSTSTAATPLSETTASGNGGSTENLSVGFLGCGTIASAIARGLIRAANNNNDNANDAVVSLDSVVVSRRSEAKSRALLDAYQKSDAFHYLSVTEDNQEILDRCNLIFLTVLPQQASSVLRGLNFDPDRHVLVSLVSTANLEDLVKDSGLDRSRVAKMICLPSISDHRGVALLCCGETSGTTRQLLVDLFGAMGGVVALDTEADLEACMVTTCTMGPLYGTMKNQRDWLLKQTGSLSKEDATFLVIRQFVGAVLDADRATVQRSSPSSPPLETRLEDLIEEQTPGGLNEQALGNYGDILGGFADLQEPVMDAILSRIRGETDGSIELCRSKSND